MLKETFVYEVVQKAKSKIFLLEGKYNQSTINELRLKILLDEYRQDIPKAKLKNI